MLKSAKKILVVLLVSTFIVSFMPISTVCASNIDEPFEGTAGAMAFDVILMRPVGIAATIVGTAIFIVSLPFSALGGNQEAAAEKLINEPLFFTFQRPLGQLNGW
jgi:hypothetical protein